MILENLRDRMPLSFSPKPKRLPPNPRRGEGKRRIMEQRQRQCLLGWQMLTNLPFRQHVYAQLSEALAKATAEAQLASDGGLEVRK